MSIEDPRLSSIDNTSAADDFDSAVEQHLGFASEAVEGIEVAQAETPDAGRTDRLPAQPPVQTAAAVIPSEVTPNAQNVVTLPAGIELDNLEFEVDGDNLVLILADGTEIVVVGGAANIPTFVIGDVELPQVALFAALEGSNINVAAGPDGTFTAQGAPDASRNFQDDPIDAGPEDFALADLLGDTAFGDELRTGTILGDDGEPTILSPLTESFIYDEAVIAGGEGVKIISGRLPFEPGPDFGTISAIGFAGASNVDEEGNGPQVLSGFTSGGRPISIVTFPAPSDGNVLDFLALEGRDSEGNLVFTITITNRVTGDFTFELVGKLEHPDAGQNGSQDDLDDLLRLGFTYTVTDLDGDSVTGSFNIDVMDDAPTIGAPVGGSVEEDDLFGKIDEPMPEYEAKIVSDGPFDGESDMPSPYTYPTAGGSLGIRWGADDDLKSEDTNDNNFGDDDPVGRTVSFTGLTTESDYAAIVAAIPALDGLRSDGVLLGYRIERTVDGDGIWNGGYRLVAFKNYYEGPIGEEGPFVAERIVFEGPGYGEVFIITLDPTSANGSYTFELIGNLDHYEPGTDVPDLPGEFETAALVEVEEEIIAKPVDFLDFKIPFTATDSDGDSVDGSVTVRVEDDEPVVVGKPLSFTVDEDDIDTSASTGTSPNDGDGDGSYTGNSWEDLPGAATVSGYLGGLVDFGADDHDPVFSLINTPEALKTLTDLGLTSQGETITYQVVGNVLYGYVNGKDSAAGYQGGQDRLVLSLEVYSYGGFEFRLHDQLDHDKPAFGRDQNTDLQDQLPVLDVNAIDFGGVIQATDFDGDSVALGGHVLITVRDDVPQLVRGASEQRTVDEDDISTLGRFIPGESLGTSPNDGNGDGSFTDSPFNDEAGPAFISGSLAGLVKSGADEALNFSFINESVARAMLESLGLSSKGAELSYDIRDGVLYAFDNAGEGKGESYDAQFGDRLVFALKLNTDGSYEFRLYDQLDHDAPDDDFRERPTNSDENFDLEDGLGFRDVTSINFGGLIKATDHDGDSVSLDDAFSIRIRDDVPELSGAKENRIVDEDDIKNGQSVGNTPNDGNGDGSFTGSPISNGNGPAFLSGSLANLIKGGADDTVKFSFISEAAARAALDNLGLSSKGAELSYDIRDGVLYAFDNAGPSKGESYDSQNGDRLVFKLTLEEDGSYSFELVDQIDHDLAGGENTDLQDDLLFKDVEAIDFGSIIKATDYDGDSVSLGGAFSITIRDDVPVLSGAKEDRLVDEDDIDTPQSTGTSPKDGNADGSWTGGPGQNGKGGAFIDGSLAHLVKGGADDTVKFSFIDENAARTELDKLGLSSKGAELSYDIRDGVLYAFDNAGPSKGDSYDSQNGDRLVFKLTLNENGSYSFELVDQLDHDPADGENTDLQDDVAGDVEAIDFGSIIKATDNDGDSVVLKDAFSITIKDDVPVLSGAKENRLVDEDDIDTAQSTGTSPKDGNADGSWTGGPNQNGKGGAFIDGSLTNLVKGGADDVIKFSFISENAARDALEKLGLKSKGAELSYDIRDGVLYAFDNAGPSKGDSYDSQNGDRLVFKLTLNENGSYSFELVDQLDHDPADGQNTDLQDAFRFKDVEAIDFGSIIKATDNDGDSVSLEGAFSITIRDDVPELSGKTEARTVDEDDILTGQSTGSNPTDGEGDGSFTGGPGQNGQGPAFINGSLASLVKGGSDEGTTFSFSSNAASVLQGLGLKSDGAALSYEVKGNVLYGFDNKNGTAGYGEGDRVVFKLTLNANGSYQFELVDQLDHVKPGDGADENFPLQPGLATINFGSVIKATDYDGDSISLDGAFSIRIRDDIPTAEKNPLIQLDDDALKNGIPGGPGDDVETAVLTGTLAHEAGADGVASILWAPDGIDVPYGFWFQISADGKTMTITQNQGVNGDNYVPVFKAVITNTLTGAYEVTQLAPVKHPEGTIPGTEDNIVKIGFQYLVTDGDGDVARGTVNFNIDDDTPTVGENALIQLDDDALSGGNAGGIGDDVQATLLTGTLAHSGGADGTASVLWAPNGISVPFGFWFDLSSDGKTMTITQNQGPGENDYVPVFKAVITDPATGAYQITQLAPVKHGAAGTEDNAEISFQYRVTDGDGDVATGTLTINVDDDTPVAKHVEASRVLDDEAQDEFDGNNGSNLPWNATDVSPNRSTVNGGAGSLFSAGADGMKSVSIVGPALAVVFMNAEGFAQTETVTWGAGTPGEGGSTIFTATSTNYPAPEGAAVLRIGADGSYTFTMKAPLAHPQQGFPEQLAEEEQTLRFDFTVVDGDNDTASGSLSIKIDDDTPEPLLNLVEPATLDDEAQTVFTPVNTGGSGDVNPDAKMVSGGAGTLFSMGADGLSDLAVELPAFVVLAKAANGLAVPELVEWSEGVRSAGGVTTFTATSESYPGGAAVLVIRADGSYTFTLNAPMAHTVSATKEDNSDLVFGYVVTDGDGDKAAGALKISIDDDTPVATSIVSEETVSVGHSVCGSLSPLVAFGADGIGMFSVETDKLSASLTSLTSNGSPLTYNVVGDTLYGKVGNVTILTFKVDPQTGEYTFKQIGPIDQTSGVPAVGKSIEVPAEPGNGFQFVGRDDNGNAIIKITNTGSTPLLGKLDWTGDEIADLSVTIGAGKTAYVNIGKPPANIGQSGNTSVELLDGSKNPPQTVVNPGHGTFDGVALGVVVDLSSAVTIKDGDGDKLALSGQLNITICDGGEEMVGPASLKAVYTDPLILDLDKNGFAFSSIDNGVTFDINADGKGDQIAWTSDDGILAYDVDGDGVIDNGSEIFTPDFNGGKFASGVAALASLDTNGDGKIDANDDAFSKLQVWVDADNDGVSDEVELSSLSENGVASISLTTDQTGGEEDGQTIFAEGEFTFADGSTGNFVEVGFETIFGSDLSEGLTLHGGMGEVVMTGSAGADTFVFDETALNDLDVADVITDFNSDEGDVLDVTALLDSLLGEQLTTDTAASHLRATVEDGNTTVSVQTATDTWKDVVVLQNHDTAIKVLFDDKHTVVTPHD